MDCSEGQYRYNGGCHPCLLCGPGLELSEDCGYGSGRSAYCVPCSVKTYKENWDYHNCRFCQSCKHLNRRQKSPCNSRRNTVCGECLPGFYSKTRVDGLQDLECMPCSPSSAAEQPCSRIGEVDVEVWSPESPTPDVAVATTICVALATMAIILSVVMFTCFRYTLLRKMFKGCLDLRSTSQDDMEMATSTVSRVTLTPEQEGQGAGPCDNFTSQDSSTRQSSSVEMFVLPGFISVNPDPGPLDRSQMLETQPLVRNSTCSNCPSGFVSQMSSEPPSDSGDLTVEPPALPLDTGESVAGSWQGSEDYCASEQQQQSHHHVPVECTELDLHSITASGLDLHGPINPHCSSVSLEMAPLSEIRDVTSVNGSGQQWRSPAGVWRMELTGAGAAINSPAAAVLEVVTRPWWSLALKLDPTFPGVQNYQQVALKRDIPREVLKGLCGFEYVFQYLSSCTLLTVPDLLHTFHLLQRLDTLRLLCECAMQSQTQRQAQAAHANC